MEKGSPTTKTDYEDGRKSRTFRRKIRKKKQNNTQVVKPN